MSSHRKTYDIVIVGGGPAGLSFACLASGAGLRLAVVESQAETSLADPAPDGRDIALTHFSIQILQEAGAWGYIADADVAPIKRAYVRNAKSPHLLRFDQTRTKWPDLVDLVSNQNIRRALYRAAKDCPDVDLFAGNSVSGLALEGPAARATLSSGETLECPLVVGADSRFSNVRRMAGISAQMRDFSRIAIVCRLKHEKPHDGTAYEWFDTDQTLAVLPLNDRESSIVITLPGSAASRAMDLPPHEFAADVEQRFDSLWGHMELSGERHSYPLVATYADRFSAQRLALIGDAAVGMHPVTAHGFNFGLQGADVLCAKIRAASRAKEDIGSTSVLQSYDRAHRKATYPLYVATNALVALYTHDGVLTRLARDAVLRLADGLLPAKDWILHKLTETDETRTAI